MDSETREIGSALLGMINAGALAPREETTFRLLALRLFNFQYERNQVYRRYCESLGRGPADITDWREIPAIPTGAFKQARLTCFPSERAAAVFESSGTTGVIRSAHHLPTLAWYEASLLCAFDAFVLPDLARMRMLMLTLSPALAPRSSLSHMLETMLQRRAAPGSGYFISADGIQFQRLLASLEIAQEQGEPVCLLGPAFAFVHLLDHCVSSGRRFNLPPRSRIVDTGGYKGRSREVPKAELHQLYADLLGVPAERVVNEYGMTEMGSQFYDNVLVRKPPSLTRHKIGPPWVRTLVIDPETMEVAALGQVGLLRHFDLTNIGSVLALQTEDLGVEVDDGFEILGRIQGAEARGCSISIDELLSDTSR